MTTLLPGTEVQARGLRWEVVDAQTLGPQVLYRLRGREGASTGRELDLLHPFEQIEPVIHDLRPDRAAPLRNWLVYHQAFLLEQALGPDALLVAQPGRLRIEPYQLVPVLRAIRMSRVRLLLADGVGLGKTIQAGLVLTELIARRLAHRILIVTPAGPLLEQWKTEMSERFGLRLDVIDRARLEEIRRSTELGANPFDHIPLGLASIDFLKQERVLDMLERASYDAVVIDEAHHCAEVGATADREDSLRRRLAEVLARRCDALLLLTATPHDGNDRSFASLCELLDPSLVDGRGVLRGDRYRPHVVRRLKRHVVDPATGAPRFKDRIVEPRPVTASPSKHPAFVALQRALLDLLAPELRRAFRARRYSDVLAFLALLKRSVSTVEACRDTLAVVADRFQQALTAGAQVEFHTNLGYWELQNRAHALNNCCYVLSPNNGPKYFSVEDQTPSATGGAGGKSMIINYRGQIMCEVDGVNITYAAALLNVEELRSYRTESRYNPLTALIPELWGKLYSKAAEHFPWPKNLYLDRPLDYEQRKAAFDEVADKMVKNGVFSRPGTA